MANRFRGGESTAAGTLPVNILVLGRSMGRSYLAPYHRDFLEALSMRHSLIFYGPGYKGFDPDITWKELLSKVPAVFRIDLILISTSWDLDDSVSEVNPCPRLNLREAPVPKIYYLNKEYKKLERRFEYAAESDVSLLLTASPTVAKRFDGEFRAPVRTLMFAWNQRRQAIQAHPKDIDFLFLGSVHRSHLPHRQVVKSQIFRNSNMVRNRIRDRFAAPRTELSRGISGKRVVWREPGSRLNPLPSGSRYFRMLSRAQASLSSLSAAGIVSPRFFELMASQTLIIAPREVGVGGYGELFRDGDTFANFHPDGSDFLEVLEKYLSDNSLRGSVVSNAFRFAQSNTYDARAKEFDDYLARLGLLN